MKNLKFGYLSFSLFLSILKIFGKYAMSAKRLLLRVFKSLSVDISSAAVVVAEPANLEQPEESYLQLPSPSRRHPHNPLSSREPTCPLSSELELPEAFEFSPEKQQSLVVHNGRDQQTLPHTLARPSTLTRMRKFGWHPIPYHIRNILLVHFFLTNYPIQLFVIRLINPLYRLPLDVGTSLKREDRYTVLLFFRTLHHIKNLLELLQPVLCDLGVY